MTTQLKPISETSPGLIAFRAVQSKLEYLYDRWQDEKEYEDFSEYKETLEKAFTEQGATVTKVTKSPFAAHFTASDGLRYIAKVTSRNISITKVKV